MEAGQLQRLVVLLLVAAGASVLTFVVLLLVLLPDRALEVPEPTTTPRADPHLAEHQAEVALLQARIAELEAQLGSRDASDAPPDAPAPTPGTPPAGLTEPPTLPSDARGLLDLLRAALRNGDRQAYNRISRALRDRLAQDPVGVLSAVVGLLRGGAAEPSLLRALGELMRRADLAEHPELVDDLRDSLVELALTEEDPRTRAEAMRALDRLLRTHEDAGGLTDRQIAQLSSRLSDPLEGESRRPTLELLLHHCADNEAVATSLLGLARSEPDLDLRTRAIQGLRQTKDSRTDELLLDLLRSEVEPRVLWEASSAANFLTQPTGRRDDYKQAYRDLVRRDVPDPARGRAAQSLALLAVLDGDVSVAGDLRHLASTTADTALAEAARTVATQLEEGTATFPTIATAWEAYHQTLDRGRYPY
jgi:hypothetical protein